MINGNMVGASMLTPKSLVLEDDNGNSFVGVIVGEKTVLTATDNDVRIGSVYAGDVGVSTGTKVIPSYCTTVGTRLISPGSSIYIPLLDSSGVERYDYTKLQVIICRKNTTLKDSVSTVKVVIDDNLYNVNSTASLGLVVKDGENKRIDFNITNDDDTTYYVRYFTYKEIE